MLLSTLLVFFSLYGSESDSEEVISKHSSIRADEAAERVLIYLFGERPSQEIKDKVAFHFEQNIHHDQSICDFVRVIESSSSSSSDYDQSEMAMRKLVIKAVQEAIEEQKLVSADYFMQLSLREKEVKRQKYRFYGALATALTSVAGVVTTVLAYNVS